MIHGWQLIYEDRLVTEWEKNSNWSKRVRVGKRVKDACVLTQAERRVYVKQGGPLCVKFVRDTRGITLTEAFRLVNEARGGTYWELKQTFKRRYQA
jgi:hypothetical protein